MIYLAYATTQREFEVEAELQERGFDVWCGRKVTFLRRGKKRRAECVVAPKLPNWIFISLSDDEWHELRRQDVKHLAPRMYVLSVHDETQLNHFKALVDHDYREGMRVAERNDKSEMVQFERGQELLDLRGRFGDVAMRFRRMVEGPDYPLVEAETEMMGRVVRMQLDPLDVRGK